MKPSTQAVQLVERKVQAVQTASQTKASREERGEVVAVVRLEGVRIETESWEGSRVATVGLGASREIVKVLFGSTEEGSVRKMS